jgi:D-glycero-alpha-D-manno-heptose 1-phosphate guanylyltransferase
MSEQGSLADVTAVILAGGLGTRLRSAVADRPKVMAEIHGRPFLSFLLDQLFAAGVGSVVLCTGYRGEQISSYFGESYGPLRLTYSREPSPLGTGGALRLALPHMDSDPVLVLNGDSFCEADFADLAARHRLRGAAATMLLAEVPNTERFGRVKTGRAGLVTEFEEKGGWAGPGLINAGVYLLGRRLIEGIRAGAAVSLEREVFPAHVGRDLYGHPGGGRFLDIGTPESFAAAEQFFSAS